MVRTRILLKIHQAEGFLVRRDWLLAARVRKFALDKTIFWSKRADVPRTANIDDFGGKNIGPHSFYRLNIGSSRIVLAEV